MRAALHRAEGGERGSVLVVAVAGLVFSVVCAALAIDLGFTAHDARLDQKVADLAALDAVRVLAVGGDPVTEAQNSAKTRNGFDYTAAGYGLAVAWAPSATAPAASWSTNSADLAAAKAVKVTATSFHKNTFAAGGKSVSRKAIATVNGLAQFSVGSDLAHVDTSASSLANLNKLMTGILDTSTAVNLTAVGYQGLAGGTVSLAELVAADSALGTPSTLLSNSTSVSKLAQASVTALNTKAGGPPANAAALAAKTALASFASTIDSSMSVKVGDILGFKQPADASAAAAQINVFDLITSAGELSIENGSHFITVPGLTVGVPGLTSSTLKLTVIEAPKLSNYGPARYDSVAGKWVTTAHTAQIDLELTNHITVGSCLVLCVDLQMPLKIAGAEATGSLTAIRCGITKENDIVVDTAGTHALAANVLAVSVASAPLALPPVVNTDVVLAGGTTSPPMTFYGPTYPTAAQSTAATGAGLSTATTSQFSVLGANLLAVDALLKPVTDGIDQQILGPLFNALGLSIGGADVVTMRVDCAVPTLAA